MHLLVELTLFPKVLIPFLERCLSVCKLTSQRRRHHRVIIAVVRIVSVLSVLTSLTRKAVNRFGPQGCYRVWPARLLTGLARKTVNGFGLQGC